MKLFFTINFALLMTTASSLDEKTIINDNDVSNQTVQQVNNTLKQATDELANELNNSGLSPEAIFEKLGQLFRYTMIQLLKNQEQIQNKTSTTTGSIAPAASTEIEALTNEETVLWARIAILQILLQRYDPSTKLKQKLTIDKPVE